MEKTIDFYLVDNYNVTKTITDKDGTKFELTNEKHKWGFLLKRNGQVDKKNNQAERIWLSPDGYAMNVDNNGSMFIYGDGAWRYYIRDDKVATDYILTLLGQPKLFNSSDSAIKSLLTKINSYRSSGAYFSDAEYLIADASSAGGMFAKEIGAFKDIAKGMPYYEANVKWGTKLREQTKGGALKVLGGIAAGFLAGGPVGAVIGGIGAGIAEAKAVAAKKEESKQLTADAKKTIETVKQIAEQKKIAEQQAAANSQQQGSELLASFGGNNLIYIGIAIVLLVGVFLFTRKS